MPAPARRPPRLELDFRSGLPVYLQIVQQVQGLAASGRLRAGDQLPTVRSLAAHLAVNFNTVARAYRVLDAAGIVSAQQGRGTFVLEKPAARTMRNMTLQALAADYIAEARRHNFTESQIGTMVARRLKRGIAARRAGDKHG
ncbi:MAG: GntR family transcriptional regulator [Chloroflexota bacterium]